MRVLYTGYCLTIVDKNAARAPGIQSFLVLVQHRQIGKINTSEPQLLEEPPVLSALELVFQDLVHFLQRNARSLSEEHETYIQIKDRCRYCLTISAVH